MPTDPKTPWTDIPAIKSRTLWAFGITVLLFVLSKLLGLDIDLDALGINAGDGWNVGELLLLVGGAIMAFFRKKAQGPISGITKPK